MPKQKYVVVDWGSWGVEVQNSSKIIVPDPLDVKKGDKCSLQGTDPATKRPMLFQGHVLAVFDSKKEADNKVTELVSPPQIEQSTLDGPRPRRDPKPTKKKLAAMENAETEKSQEPEVVPQKGKNMKRRAVEKNNEEIVSGKEVIVSQKQKSKKSRRSEENDKDTVSGQEESVSQKPKSKKRAPLTEAVVGNDNEIVTVANTKRVQNLLMRRQQSITVSDDEKSDEDETVEVRKEEERSRSKKAIQHQQSSSGNFASPKYQQPPGVANSLQVPASALHPSSGGNVCISQHQHPIRNTCTSPLRQSSDTSVSSTQHQQHSGASNNSPPSYHFADVNFSSPPQQHPLAVTGNSMVPSSGQSSDINFCTTQHQRPSGVTSSSPPVHQPFSGHLRTPQHQQPLHVGSTNTSLALRQPSGGINSSVRRALSINSSSPSLLPHCDPATPQQEFSFFKSLGHCSDFDVSDLDLEMSPHYQPETGNLISRDDVQPSLSNLPSACSACQPLLTSLNRRLCNLEAEFEKLKRKQRKGKVVIGNDMAEKGDPNEEQFNGLTKDALVRIIEDASDAKSAVEALARRLFTSEELQNSSVTGFQCNSAYEARPGLSPSRRSILESTVLKRGFPATTRSTVRKDLGLVLKKARANKENKAKCRSHSQEQKKL